MGSRAPSSCARPRSAKRATPRSSGRASSRTTSSSSGRTTARSTSTARRRWPGATSGRSPTGCRASRLASISSTTAAWARGGSARAVGASSSRRRRRGGVGVGYDDDIVVYDPTRKHILSASTHHMDVDYSCYEGRTVVGGSDVVLSRGLIVVDGERWLGHAGHGKFQRRQPRRVAPIVTAPTDERVPALVG